MVFVVLLNILYIIIGIGIITREEYNDTIDYMNDNRPIKQYYTCEGEITRSITQFWYPIGQPYYRIKWLKKHIKLNT